jgi:hypothetical protein
MLQSHVPEVEAWPNASNNNNNTADFSRM